DQDLPHRLRSDPEEVCAVLKRAIRIRKLEVGLVQERGGVERRRRALAPTLPVRQLMQLVVQQRQKCLKRFIIAVPRRVQEQRHVASIVSFHTSCAREGRKNIEVYMNDRRGEFGLPTGSKWSRFAAESASSEREGRGVKPRACFSVRI